MDCNILGLSDSYKYTHAQQYPPGTENVYSYLESRGGRYPRTVFFGFDGNLQLNAPRLREMANGLM